MTIVDVPFFEVASARVTAGGSSVAHLQLQIRRRLESASGQLYGHFLRPDREYARIVALNIKAARAHRGVHAVLTGANAVRAGYVQPVSFFPFLGQYGTRPLSPQ